MQKGTSQPSGRVPKECMTETSQCMYYKGMQMGRQEEQQHWQAGCKGVTWSESSSEHEERGGTKLRQIESRCCLQVVCVCRGICRAPAVSCCWGASMAWLSGTYATVPGCLSTGSRRRLTERVCWYPKAAAVVYRMVKLSWQAALLNRCPAASCRSCGHAAGTVAVAASAAATPPLRRGCCRRWRCRSCRSGRAVAVRRTRRQLSPPPPTT